MAGTKNKLYLSGRIKRVRHKHSLLYHGFEWNVEFYARTMQVHCIKFIVSLSSLKY